MSTCMTCGGKREHNILTHKPTCPFYPQTTKAAIEAKSRAELLREHPDLAELELALDNWYPNA